jgi:hypothetical protein
MLFYQEELFFFIYLKKFLQICLNEHVYIDNESGNLHYFAHPKQGHYTKFLDKVKAAENEKEFLEEFKHSLYFTVQEVEKGADIWKEFMEKIIKTNSLLFYKENYYAYLIKIFTEYFNEGIQHLESRCLLGSVLDEVLIIFFFFLHLTKKKLKYFFYITNILYYYFILRTVLL